MGVCFWGDDSPQKTKKNRMACRASTKRRATHISRRPSPSSTGSWASWCRCPRWQSQLLFRHSGEIAGAARTPKVGLGGEGSLKFRRFVVGGGVWGGVLERKMLGFRLVRGSAPQERLRVSKREKPEPSRGCMMCFSLVFLNLTVASSVVEAITSWCLAAGGFPFVALRRHTATQEFQVATELPALTWPHHSYFMDFNGWFGPHSALIRQPPHESEALRRCGTADGLGRCAARPGVAFARGEARLRRVSERFPRALFGSAESLGRGCVISASDLPRSWPFKGGCAYFCLVAWQWG